MPKVSVIIPVYNKEKYIEASLRSVLDQPFRDLEVIVVNDGSTDGSLPLIHQLSREDDRIRVVDIPNNGVSNARNTGLRCAKGEWIQFLDGDDLLEPEYLTTAMELLNAHPADILFSGFTMVDPGGGLIRQIDAPETGMRTQKDLCHCFAACQYTTGFFGFISNKLFRRSLWEHSGAEFPVGTTLAEDLDFYVRLYPHVKHAFFWKGLSFRYLQTDSNYARNTEIDYFSQIRIHLDINRWFQTSGEYPTYHDLLDGRVAAYACFILFYDNEAGRDLSHGFHFLRRNQEIMDCVVSGSVTGFHRLVLFFLRRGNLCGIKTLFALRNGMRSLYRSIRK